MPKVGELEFKYDKEGMEAAKQYSKSTNQEIEDGGEKAYLVANNKMSGEGNYPESDARNRKKMTMGYGGNDNPYKNLK